MQLVHNGEGLYCLHTPSFKQAKRTLFNLPTRKKTTPIKSEIRRKKSSKPQCTKRQCTKRQCTKPQCTKRQCTKPQCTKRQCTKTSQRGRTKMSARNRPVEAKKMYVDLYIYKGLRILSRYCRIITQT